MGTLYPLSQEENKIKKDEKYEYKVEKCNVQLIVSQYRLSDKRLVNEFSLSPFTFYMVNAANFEGTIEGILEQWLQQNKTLNTNGN